MIARAMPDGDILGFAPPLMMTRAEVDEMVAIAEKAVRQVMDEIAAAQVIQAPWRRRSTP